jgi:hypothetical protein
MNADSSVSDVQFMPCVTLVCSSAGRFQDHQIFIEHGLARQDAVMIVVEAVNAGSIRLSR